ncbi:MAG: M64 family metallopeptidase [Candidatus Nanoarchaeia archaeon]|nr:M64 family metallopeptidase [Candidatus Nanoarchaeia archaeon]
MKRGQISQVFIYLFALLIIVFVLIFGFSLFSKSKQYGESVDIQNFVSTLSSKIESLNQLEEGSEQTFLYLLPSTIDKICFADSSELDKTVDSELNLIYSKEKNLYLFPGQAYKINSLYLDKNPLCIQKNSLSLKLTKNKDGVSISSEDSVEKCNTLLFNKEDNIDILFIPESYTNMEAFLEDSKDYMAVLLSKEPLISNKKVFNFYSLNEIPELSCTKDYILLCDLQKIQKAAISCPHDIIVVLSKNGKLSGLRSTSQGNIIIISTGDNKLVISHEFGHAFANLADEYLIKEFKGNLENAPNCDTSPCKKWNGNGCYGGCSLDNYYRPSADSIMKSFGLFSDNEFNQPSREAFIEKMGVYQ